MKQYHSLSVTPAVDTSAYAAGDQIATLQTLAGATEAGGTGAMLEKLVVVDKAKQKSALKIYLFDDEPTVASADNAAADVSDAEVAAKCIGVVSVAAGDYSDLNASSVATVTPALAVKPARGVTSLYALIVSGGTPTYTAATDLVLKLTFSWE